MAGWLPRLFTSALPRIRPYSEQGVSGTPVYAGYVLQAERSPKLIGQEKYRTYSEILANTSIVAAGVRYFLNIVAKPSWNVEPADKSSEAMKMAEFVEDVLDDLHTPWSRIVRRSGTYRFQGFSIQEWTAKKRDDGKIGLHDIESRPQWTIWRWEVDERGAVTGAWQRDPLTGRELGLPRGKLMYLVDDTLTDSPEGMGLLRHCVEPAQRLEEYLKQEGYGFLRDLHGVPLGRAPVDELANAVAAGKITQAQMDGALSKLREFVSMEKKTTDTSIILNSQPYVDYTDSGNTVSGQMKWGVELISGAAPGLQYVDTAIVRLNTEMARVLGVEHLLLGADSAGSYALAKEKATDLYLLANSVLADITYQAQHDVIWPLWSLNGFKDELMPTLKPSDVSPKDVEQIGRVLRDMATAGAPLQPDDEVQNFIRDLLGAPQLDIQKLQERLAEVQAQQQEPPPAFGDDTGDKKSVAEKSDEKDQQDKKDSKREGAVQKALFAKGLVDGLIAKGANGAQEKLRKIADDLDDILMKEWDESKHPRGEHGRFGSGGGTSLEEEKATPQQKTRMRRVIDKAKEVWGSAKPVLGEIVGYGLAAYIVGEVVLTAAKAGFMAFARYSAEQDMRRAGYDPKNQEDREKFWREFQEEQREKSRRRRGGRTDFGNFRGQSQSGEDLAQTKVRIEHGIKASHIMALYLRPGTSGEKEAARNALLRMGIDPAKYAKVLLKATKAEMKSSFAALDHLITEEEADAILDALVEMIGTNDAQTILDNVDRIGLDVEVPARKSAEAGNGLAV